MRTIKLDGTKLICMQMDPNGQMNLFIQPNSTALKPGEIQETNISDLDMDKVSYKIEISNRKTFLAFIKTMLSFVDRGELLSILQYPIASSCWEIRKSNRHKNTQKENKNGKQ